MRFVDPNDVFRKYKDYLSDYEDYEFTKEMALEELKDALEDADYEELE